MSIPPSPTVEELLTAYREQVAAGRDPEALWLEAESKRRWVTKESIRQRQRRHEVEADLASVVSVIAKITEKGSRERDENTAATGG